MSSNDECWWVSVKDFLPDMGEKCLVISKWGHISNHMYTDFGLGGKPTFRPYGLVPGKDVKWWMPVPTDGWHRIEDQKPKEGEEVLAMGWYGDMRSMKYQKKIYPIGTSECEFVPLGVLDVLFWRQLPALPDGVVLNY